MGRHVAEGKKDADKDRAELIVELNALRDFNSRLKAVVKRYERVAGKKELYGSLYDFEASKDSVESLRNELREKEIEVDIQREELGVQNEELRVQLDEINARTEEIMRINEALRKGEALRESEANLSRAQRIAQVGNWVWDTKKDWVQGSDEFYRIFGMGKRDFLTYDQFINTLNPEDRESVHRAVNAALNKGEPYNIDYRVVWPDGTEHIVHAEADITLDEAGKAVRMFGTVQDITERKQAEEALRESEARFRALADNIPNLAWMAKPDGGIFWFNKQWYDYTGTTLEEMQGWGWQKVHHPDNVQKVNDRWRSSIAAGQHHENISPIRGKDGKYLCFLTRVTPIRDEQGNIQLWFGTNTDITELMRAEDALRLSEERLQLAVDGAGMGLWDMDVRTGDTIWSVTHFRMLGYEPASDGKATMEMWRSRVHPDDLSMVMQALETAKCERLPYKPEYRIIRADNGQIVWLQVFGHFLYDEAGEAVRFIGVFFDVTERRRAEDELATAKDSLAADLAGMSRLQEISTRLVSHDEMGSLLGDIIDAAIEFTGADKGNIHLCNGGGELKIVESRGFDQSYLDFFNSVHENQAACGTAMAKGERVIVEDVTKSPIFVGTPMLDVQLAAGVMAVQSTPLFNRSGRLLGMFSTHYSAPHRPEDRELLLLDMLSRQAADHIERIRDEDALKEAKAQAELYVDLMGHDISNMNHAAMGYLELALEALETEKRLKLDDKVLIERPIQSLANSSALINNVRKLQKLMTEGVKTKPTDLNKIFRELETTSFLLDDRDVLINIQHIPGFMVEANELLKDVFLNLITNAIKHSDTEKPLTVNVKVESVNENGQKYYRCMVEDDGPGIPDELKGKLFHRFQRGTTKAHGKGLGLYIVRTLVEGYHGRVWVEDRVQGDHTKGARFVVMLPAVENH